MTVSATASRCAAPVNPPTLGNIHQADLVQLQIEGINALSMASYYARRGNHPGAYRKATQALSALRRLAAFERAQGGQHDL